MGRGSTTEPGSSAILYGEAEARNKHRPSYRLLPHGLDFIDSPPLPEQPITDLLFRDLNRLPQSFTAEQRDALLAQLRRYREQGWGVTCSLPSGHTSNEGLKVVTVDGAERRVVRDYATITVNIHVRESIDLADPLESTEGYVLPCRVRVSSLLLDSYEPDWEAVP